MRFKSDVNIRSLDEVVPTNSSNIRSEESLPPLSNPLEMMIADSI